MLEGKIPLRILGTGSASNRNTSILWSKMLSCFCWPLFMQAFPLRILLWGVILSGWLGGDYGATLLALFGVWASTEHGFLRDWLLREWIERTPFISMNSTWVVVL